MPTSRRRHAITETDSVAVALHAAAERWPEDAERPQRLLLRLVAEGHRALLRDELVAQERRRRAVEQTSGALTGLYEPGYLDDLREDWPE